MDYLKNPADIYEKSFAIIKSEADLSRFSEQERDIVIRLIHSCGMVDIVNDLVFSKGAVREGRAALKKAMPIICDVGMVAKGIIKRNLPQNNQILCAINENACDNLAQKKQITRSMAAMEILKHKMKGAIIAIGNAPSALFYLLELIEKENIKPALILGFPVGFVGAVESKQALIENNLSIPFIALKGRRGGSSLAAACVNALAVGLKI